MKYKFTTLDGREFIFGQISAEDADRYYISLKNKRLEVEEFIFNKVTDNQYNSDDLEAGIISTIVFLSFKISGLFKKATDFPDKIDEARKRVNDNAYFLVYSAIIKANPGLYRLDDVRAMSINKLLEEFALAELVLGMNAIDTEKARKMIEEAEAAKNNTPVKKGIKAFTQEEMNILLSALDNDNEGF